ncbi:uncharacterized protein LOC105699128 [Orussus abietinus]|uniref:uncharacterized protein LOC105699128 n=1 Tax=Orussus abietinus TaxID=222816 RepID=UPI00062622EA|nr:uncharacterized protein LOC105699128 [Orussus abietinus]
MLAASLCREVHFSVLPSTMSSRVPRCLFGKPNPKESAEMLQEALDAERSKFARRWGVDPTSEDKENLKFERVERSPKKKSNPYSRQTNIHDFWRARKMCDVNKKSMASIESPKQQGADKTNSK